QKRVDHQSEPNQKSCNPESRKNEHLPIIETPDQKEQRRSQTDRAGYDALTHRPHSTLLGRFKELLNLRQNIFDDLFEVLSGFKIADSIGNRVAYLIASRNRRRSDRIRFLQTNSDRSQIRSADATELADLSL